MNADETTPPENGGDQEKDWIYRESTKRLLWTVLVTSCGLSLVAGLFGHRHGHFEVDEAPGFYALLGFGTCTIMIFAAKGLGYVLKKAPDFYERPGDADAVAEDNASEAEEVAP